MVQCCAFDCKRSGKFYFPKDLKLKKKWEVAVKRSGFRATRHSRLCPDHFKPDDFCEKEGFYSGVPRIVLRNDAIPSIFSFNKVTIAKAVQRRERALKRTAKRQLNDDIGILYYTGLESYEKFLYVFNTLCPEAHHIKYRYNNVINLSVQDQFLLSLMKIRKNMDDYELTRFFGVFDVTVSNVFRTRRLLHARRFQNIRVIVDCTEVPINKPKNPAAQQAVFSYYKDRCTGKFEVGATPSGLLCHCSSGYGGGSARDRQIVERSGLLNKCERSDSIMADRGFDVQDLFASSGVTVNIPTFLRGKSQLPGVTLLQDRKLSSKRVHIERLIGLLKTYEIRQTPLNGFYVPICSKIFFVCFMLCNFREATLANKT
ncbi:uncharacterized protein LOC117642332 [Thrips palmi]|uniref:Uncharacterized protein LOC117642332 n=1 Tax=Thrips palmi TaxID=161013 RepID=A0A6P8ZK13_THRPL|nr:uncharacterized protein LOC117642332 [Thrips palmi]